MLLDKENNNRKEMQILFDSEKDVLMERHKNDEKALANMQDHIEELRKREQDVKNELETVSYKYIHLYFFVLLVS